MRRCTVPRATESELSLQSFVEIGCSQEVLFFLGEALCFEIALIPCDGVLLGGRGHVCDDLLQS